MCAWGLWDLAALCLSPPGGEPTHGLRTENPDRLRVRPGSPGGQAPPETPICAPGAVLLVSQAPLGWGPVSCALAGSVCAVCAFSE